MNAFQRSKFFVKSPLMLSTYIHVRGCVHGYVYGYFHVFLYIHALRVIPLNKHGNITN
jgi:hypothetical protein